MKLLLLVLALCILSQTVLSVTVLGKNILAANGKAVTTNACYDSEAKEYIIPEQNFFSSTSFRAYLPTKVGAFFYSVSGGSFDFVGFHNTSVQVHPVGGKTGHFTGGSIQGLATDGKKLYVCGSFTKYGNDTIDAGNVVILNIEPQFDQETAKPWYELEFTAAPVNDLYQPNHKTLDCSTMFMLDNKLHIKESGSPARWLRLDDTKWTNITGLVLTPQHAVITNSTVYVLARDMRKEHQASDRQFIQKYTTANGWATVVPESNETQALSKFAIGATDQEVYGLFSSNTPEQPHRHQYVHKISIGTGAWTPIGGGRFSSSPSQSNAFTSASLNLHFDPFSQRLVVYGGFTYFVYGEGDDDRYLYAQKIPNMMAYDPEKNTYVPGPYGGGLDVVPSEIRVFGDRYTCFYSSTLSAAFDTYVHTIGQIDPNTQKLVPLFGSKWKGVDSHSATSEEAEINAYALFKSENGTSAFIAGKFRSINNVTVNSIALIDPEGNATPLGEGDAVGVRLLPGNSLDNMLAPHGTISTIEYVPSQGAVYVGGTFNLAGDSGATGIAKYDIATKKWSHVAGGIATATIFKILYSARYNSLFITGGFTAAGNVHTLSNIVRYRLDTQQWEPMGFGFGASAIITDIIEYNGGILVSLDSGTQAGLTGQKLFFWNGAVWERFNVGENPDSGCVSMHSCTPQSTIFRLKPYGNRLFLLEPGSPFYIQEFNTQFRTIYPTFASAILIEVDNAGKLHIFNNKERRIVNTNNYNPEQRDLFFTNNQVEITSDAKSIGMSVAVALISVMALIFAF